MKKYQEFLKQVEPFNRLPETVLSDVSDLMQFKEYPQDTVVYLQDKSAVKTVDIIVKGEYKACFYDDKKNLLLEEHYIQGTIYAGSSVLLNKTQSIRTVTALKGTEILTLDKEEFKSLCRSFDAFFHHFTTYFGQKMMNDNYAHLIKKNTTLEENFIDADHIFTRKINSITPHKLVICTPETPVSEVARLMVDNQINCLFIQKEEKITGIITKDLLLKKILATSASSDTPVKKVAKKKYISIEQDALLYEALLAMFQSKLDFVLVKNSEKYLGYLSRYRLLTEHAQSPLVFIQSVKLASTIHELREKWIRVPEVVSKLIGRGVNAEIVNRIVTTISDEILLRVIDNVREEMAPAPARYAFMVMGSEGRQEQTLVTDQDNAIIYEDKANEQRELVRNYFLDFAHRISTRLNDIGFKFCDGGFMAQNPQWTHSLSHWKANYEQWTHAAAPDTVIKFATFFDCRFIYGERKLFTELKKHMISCMDQPSAKFLQSLARNALHFEPPLTFFKSIRTFEKDERKVFNIKQSMTPIVDLMRMLALKNKIIETNTGKRMQKLFQKNFLTENQYKELMHAYYYLMGVRLRNQAESILVDFEEPTNFLEPKRLTQVEQVTLREIFKFIKDYQSTIKMEFNA